MKEKLEIIRRELHMAIDKYGINSKNTILLSQKFNELLNLYYQSSVEFSEDNLINIKYIESIKILKKISKDFSKFPTVDEWNKYAKEHNLLSSESIKYIAGVNWHDIRNKINK